MKRPNLRILTAAVALGTLAAACGDDGPTEPQDLPCEAMAGVYEPTTLTFDVNGNLSEQDILARIEPVLRPLLVIDRVGGFQLAFRDSETGRFTTAEGTCTLVDQDAELEFSEATDAERLLLPARLPLDYDGDSGTLSFQGAVSVSRTRLQALVPEFSDEPLTDPVPGDLAVIFSAAED